MTTDTLNVILEDAGVNWCAFTPDDIGMVIATGSTREKAILNFRAALKSRLELMAAEGLPVPAIQSLNIQELMPA